MSQLYFAYGSNLWPPRLEQRIGACVQIGGGVVTGYRLRFWKIGGDGSGKGDIVKADPFNDKVYGAVYQLTKSQQAALHQFEGRQYEVKELTVTTDNERLLAYTYLARSDAIQNGIVPFDWYKAFVVRGAGYFCLPSYYQKFLQNITAKTDPDNERNALNWAIATLPPSCQERTREV